MAGYQSAFRVISSKLTAGRPLIHVYCEEHPGDGFEPAAADLEDVFFSCVLEIG